MTGFQLMITVIVCAICLSWAVVGVADAFASRNKPPDKEEKTEGN